MAIRHWEPERSFLGIRRFIDDVMDEAMSGLSREREGAIIPPVDVSESSYDIVVKAELPGMKKTDIKLSLEGNILTISGEKKEEKEQKNKNYHLVERRFGSFRRSLALPMSIDVDKVKATYKNGVLIVTIPKKEEAKGREIKVEGE